MGDNKLASSTSPCCGNYKEGVMHPIVPPRKRSPAKSLKTNNDGDEGLSKKVRPIAVIKGTRGRSFKENKPEKEESTSRKGLPPCRPPPPLIHSTNKCVNNMSGAVKNDEHSGVRPSSKVKLKPPVPQRPSGLKSHVRIVKQGAVPCVIMKENSETVKQEAVPYVVMKENSQIVKQETVPCVEMKESCQIVKQEAVPCIGKTDMEVNTGLPITEHLNEVVAPQKQHLTKVEDQSNLEHSEKETIELVVKKPRPTPRPRRKTEVIRPVPQPRKTVRPASTVNTVVKPLSHKQFSESCLELGTEDSFIVQNNKSDIIDLGSNTTISEKNNSEDLKSVNLNETDETLSTTGNMLDHVSHPTHKTNFETQEKNNNTILDKSSYLHDIPLKKERSHTFVVEPCDLDSKDMWHHDFNNRTKSLSEPDLLSPKYKQLPKKEKKRKEELCQSDTNCKSGANKKDVNNAYENTKLQTHNRDDETSIKDVNAYEKIELQTHNHHDKSENVKVILPPDKPNKQNAKNVYENTGGPNSLSESLINDSVHHRLHKHSLRTDSVDSCSDITEGLYSIPTVTDEKYVIDPTADKMYDIPPNADNTPLTVEEIINISLTRDSNMHPNNRYNDNMSTSSGVSKDSRFSSASNASCSSIISEKSYENYELPTGDQPPQISNSLPTHEKAELTTANRKQQRTRIRRDDAHDVQIHIDTSYENISPGHEEVADKSTRRPMPSNQFLPTTLLRDRLKDDERLHTKRISTVIDAVTGNDHNIFESDSDEEEIVGPCIVEQEKPKSKLFSIAQEILTTEKSFVGGLQLVCEEFGGPLKAAIARNSKLLPDGTQAAMFMNIEQIYELEKKFLGDLEERMHCWDLHQRIGDLVREYGHFLLMYTVYIKGYDNAINVFLECQSNNMKFQQIVEDFEKSNKAKNMQLSSFLLKPIQRIPSYRLLLVEYLKYLPEDHLDYKDISDGLDLVCEVASHINESMKEGEKFNEVLRIQSLIINCKDIVKPGRYLIKEGALQKLSRKDAQQRSFILFTDALLYCSYMGSQLKLINELPLVGMSVQIQDTEDLTYEFIVISTKRSLLLNAKSPEEKEEWVEALNAAIRVANDKEGTFIAKKDCRSQSLVNTELGYIAPPWIPDSRVTMCQICTDIFTVVNRRHHCRACGKVVCNDCSAYEAPLRYMENKSERVCEVCYNLLVQQYTGDNPSDAGFKERKRNKAKSAKSAKFKLGEGGFVNSGYMWIKRGTKKEKRCWFVLKDYVLYRYKAVKNPDASSTYPLPGYEVRKAGNWDEEDFQFTLTHSGLTEVVVLRAGNREQAEKWVDCLSKATNLES